MCYTRTQVLTFVIILRWLCTFVFAATSCEFKPSLRFNILWGTTFLITRHQLVGFGFSHLELESPHLHFDSSANWNQLRLFSSAWPALNHLLFISECPVLVPDLVYMPLHSEPGMFAYCTHLFLLDIVHVVLCFGSRAVCMMSFPIDWLLSAHCRWIW
jgi:hypothetical protein